MLTAECVACRVWYLGPGSQRIPTRVLSVDTSHPPPFYALKMPGTDVVRETEGHRLTAMTPEEQAAQDAEDAASTAGRHSCAPQAMKRAVCLTARCVGLRVTGSQP